MFLTLNAGSSSLKFALFDADLAATLRGQITSEGTSATDGDGAEVPAPDLRGGGDDAMIGPLLAWLHGQPGGEHIAAVGHRIVHGGQRFTDPVRIDASTLAELEALVVLAPLHQPHSLAAIRAVTRAAPGVPQIGCFDTAFHRTMPEVARRIALPRDLTETGLQRYGFHGLSYAFVARRLRELDPRLASGRVIVAHLGQGASLCAMRDGCSIETTMGFSALDGLVMGTRPGCLDPGALLHLIQAHGMDAAAIEDLLYHRSGLLGVSGESADMRVLAASAAPAARQAIELFAYRVAGEAGRLASALGGLDGFVFTAGIGEHDAALRADIARRLAWLGASLDPAANAAGKGRINDAASRLALWVIPTDEQATIAREMAAVISERPW